VLKNISGESALSCLVWLFLCVFRLCFFCRVLLHHGGGLSQDQNVREFCEELYSSGNRSPFLLAFLIDMCEENIERGDGDKADSLHRALQVMSCSENFFLCNSYSVFI
jgi:hypothetical protein